MKSGASDPFAEDSQTTDTDQDTTESNPAVSHQQSETEQNSITDSTERSDRREKTKVSQERGELSRDQLPYILRREKVKDERPEVHQLFVQQETHSAAIDAERELEDRISDSLSRTDAREAIYRAGMEHLGDAEEILRSWGYDL